MIILMRLSSTLHLLESWDRKYQRNLPVSESHMVKRRVVGEWVPLESGSETMTVSVLATTHISRNQLTSYSTQVHVLR